MSVQGAVQLQQQSVEIGSLQSQLKTLSKAQEEMKGQSAMIGELQTQLHMGSARLREITRQASILEDLKDQLSRSDDLSVELMFKRSSLEEARALMSEALRARRHTDSSGMRSTSFNSALPAASKVSRFCNDTFIFSKKDENIVKHSLLRI